MANSIKGRHIEIGNEGDPVPAIRSALEECRGRRNSRIVFRKGTYHFRGDKACEKYLFISNNDEGLKRIAFPITDIDGLEIDGQGSEFIFHGLLMPFLMENSKNIRLKNFTIDWAHPFHFEGKVLESHEDHVILTIPGQFEYKIENGRLLPVIEGDICRYEIGNALEFDAAKLETAFKVSDNYGLGSRCSVEEIGERKLRLNAKLAKPLPKPGNILVMTYCPRLCPGISVIDSGSIEISDVTLHYAPGMGVVAQNSSDIKLERFDVRLKAGGGRIISTIADATHFVNCSGHIEVYDCLFENQMDDPMNVHGIYVKISGMPDPRSIEVRLIHHQQLGIDTVKPGSEVEFLKTDTVQPYLRAKVESVERINREYSIIRFKESLPEDVSAGDVIVSLDSSADLTVRGITARCNRARGILVSTPGKVLIENNVFHTPGAAILIAGDCNYWFESGSVRDVCIRNNRFDNCNYGVWGLAAIEINPEIRKRTEPRINRNIRIIGNEFTVFDPRIVSAHSVEGLVIEENSIKASSAHPQIYCGAKAFDIQDCSNVSISGNSVPAQEKTPEMESIPA